ncbi:MAG: recombinase RecA [Candidatus Pacebacteria bacterium]|nr:recombinase RecA [Candidatus Paceibacterota bacterium]
MVKKETDKKDEEPVVADKKAAAPIVSDKKEKAIKDALDEIQSRFGEGAIMKLGDAKSMDVDFISTGSISLDIALGGGIPKGRIVEIYGLESSGKTTLTLHVISEAQKRGESAAFVDAEHALDPEYAKKIGVNTKELIVSQPDSGEQALEIVEALVRSGAVDVIVIDSVAALTPRAEIEGEMGDSHMGLQARLMSQALRKLTAIVSKSNCTVIFINQIRMKIGVVFGNPETTTGGNALKFYSSVRIEVRKAAQIKQGENIIGNRVKAKVVKNKVAAPFKVAEFDIMYNEGISYLGDLLNVAVEHGVAKKGGAWYNYKEIKLGQGFEASKKFLKDNPKIIEEMAKEVKEAIKKEELAVA